MNPWEQRPGEPTTWFSRFERYKLAGAGRTLEKIFSAEKAQKGTKRHKESKQASGAWKRAYDQWDWKSRAEAWDRAEIAARRQRDEEAFRTDLERHRANCLALSRSALAASINLLKKLNEVLETLSPEVIPIERIPQFLRAIAATATASIEGEALALQVTELLKERDDSNSK